MRTYDGDIARLQSQLDAIRYRADMLRAADTDAARDERRSLAAEAHILAEALAGLRAAIRAEHSGPRAAATLQRLVAIHAAQRDLRRLRSRVALRDAGHVGDAPDGWLGVTLSGESKWVNTGNRTRVYHYDYPVIEAVEPGSPADAAGLKAGDTIVAYDHDDVRRREIALGDLLRPGHTLALRVHRAGAERELPVLVARRPRAYAPQVAVRVDPFGEIRVTAEQIAAEISRDLPRVPHPPRALAPALADGYDGSPRAAALPSLPSPPSLPPPLFGAPGELAVAGAVVTPLTPDLREALDAPQGVLVLTVGTSTPAEDAGLRGGDVIVRAGGGAISAPLDLQRALQRSAAGSCELEVVRKGARRKLTLRW